jgi:hypothetical protein
MQCLEKLGFERRERYYAGAQAGWGAQILEQAVEGIVAFCDVDLEPHETEIDFSRVGLPPSKRLGTIGLWVGLHGESFLQAGMHHLECRFDYDLLRKQLAEESVNTMNPFSDFPFLKQAFTEGERWPVRRERAEHLLKRGLLDQASSKSLFQKGRSEPSRKPPAQGRLQGLQPEIRQRDHPGDRPPRAVRALKADHSLTLRESAHQPWLRANATHFPTCTMFYVPKSRSPASPSPGTM